MLCPELQDKVPFVAYWEVNVNKQRDQQFEFKTEFIFFVLYVIFFYTLYAVFRLSVLIIKYAIYLLNLADYVCCNADKILTSAKKKNERDN